MRRVEWSWVKAHNGRLLNESADELATRGIMNVQRECPVETVRVVGEDTDTTVYELQDGEETPTAGKDADECPTGQTYVLKAHAPDVPFKGLQIGSQSEADALVQGIEECLRETQGFGGQVMSTDGPNSEVSEDEGVFPMPEEYQESSSPQFGSETPEQASMRVYRQLKFWTAQNEWENRPKPEWWSPAWDEMAELKRPDGTRIPTGSPMEFKECITGDVIATDSFTFQSATNGVPGQDVNPSVSPDLTNVVAAGVWNEPGSTLIRRCGRDVDINELSLATFKEVLAATPDACELTYVTCSDWLLGQW
jgi:hypothetical protein